MSSVFPVATARAEAQAMDQQASPFSQGAGPQQPGPAPAQAVGNPFQPPAQPGGDGLPPAQGPGPGQPASGLPGSGQYGDAPGQPSSAPGVPGSSTAGSPAVTGGPAPWETTGPEQPKATPVAPAMPLRQPEGAGPLLPSASQDDEGDSQLSWILATFLCAIPVVGLIYLVFVGFFGSAKPERRKWARAMLVWVVIGTISMVPTLLMLGGGTAG